MLRVLAVALLCSACSSSLSRRVPDEGPPTTPICEREPGDLTKANLFEVNRLGLGLSQAVAQGTLGSATLFADRFFAPFAVDQVMYGPQFLEGTTIWVSLDANEVDFFTLPGEYVIGFGGNAYPIDYDVIGGEPWWQKKVVIPADERDDYGDAVGFRSDPAAHIVVVRIVAQNTERTTFQVVEVLAGEMPTSLFDANWSQSVYPVPFPGVGDTEYIASLSYVQEAPSIGVYLGPILDFRPATPEARALVEVELSSPARFWDAAATLAFADRYRVGWSFSRAEHVVTATVSGLAEECCTGAGGRYVANRITDFLSGDSVQTHVVTGGHGYYGTESCGDPSVMAIYDLKSSDHPTSADFPCDDSGWVDAYGLPFQPARVLRLDDTPENLEQVRDWLSSPRPVLQLHDPGQPVPALPRTGDDAIWSVPLAAEEAMLAGTLPMELTVEAVVEHGDPPWYEVTLSTAFYLYRLDHLTVHTPGLAFRCGDARLLQEGSQWLGVAVFDGHAGVQEIQPTEYERAFLVPGFLLPNLEYIRGIMNELPRVLASSS